MSFKTIDLTADQWSRAEDLFDRASALAAQERVAFLSESCAGDQDLCDYVMALLDADPGVDATIEQVIVDAMQTAFGEDDTQSADISGAMIGAYRVKRLIGQGGMGVVYLADRADDQFEQQVAIKLGRHKLLDPNTEGRLRSERQILANLDHPNIAKLFDGGTSRDGIPYLVMEYIDGIRIDEFCDSNRLSIDDRLELFRTICGAVHYAHQNLVIHRDIKASNILVTEDGTPKLLDFGIAKLIDGQGVATDGLTREGAVVMTPQNAAPEQLLGRPVTTSTDTYALGLLLHTLLAGVPAYEFSDNSAHAVAEVICRWIPPFMSVRLRSVASSAAAAADTDDFLTVEEIAHDRGTTPERLRRKLRGDLDNIVQTALRKEPERRYRSVNQMANDISYYRQSMPIHARADSWRYRTGKFVRRHYAGVAMSVLLVLLLSGFSVALSIQNQRITEERDTAQEVSRFVEDIFRSADPWQTPDRDITAREMLAAGAERVSRDLAGRPEIQSALMETIGRAYYNLGEYEPAVEMLEESLQLRQQALGEEHPGVAVSKNELAKALIRQASYDRAQTLLEESLQLNRLVNGAESLAVAENSYNLAEVHLGAGELDAAQTYANASIDIYMPVKSDYPIELAEAKNLLARILQVRGDLDTTESLLREAIEIVGNNASPDHPLVAYYLQNLGVLLKSKGDLDAAEETLDQAIEATRRILGEKHDLLATTLVIQGSLLHTKGQFDEAERVLRDALSLHIDTRGAAHPFIGYDLTSLAMVQHDRGDLDQAEESLRDALVIYGNALDEDHQYIASTMTELGAVLNSKGRAGEALEVLARALEIRSVDYESDHILVAATQAEYADALVYLGRYEEAEQLLAASFDTLRGRDDRRSRRVRKALEHLYEMTSRPGRLAELLQQSESSAGPEN